MQGDCRDGFAFSGTTQSAESDAALKPVNVHQEHKQLVHLMQDYYLTDNNI